MTQPPPKDRWAFWKNQGPVLVIAFSFIAFMNAEDAERAALFGMLAGIGIAWQIYRSRAGQKKLGPPAMQLGRLRAVGPIRMRPWHMLAVLAFALLGLAMFFSMEEAQLPARLGMSLICFAIVGAWLGLVSERLRTPGTLILGLGFLLGGASLVWEAFTVLQLGKENASLIAVKWSVFGSFMLLCGIAITLGAISKRGSTPIFSQGIVGPHGFVRWEEAERLELVESNGKSHLVVGAYNGWTLYIDVPEDSREAVAEFVAGKSNQAA